MATAHKDSTLEVNGTTIAIREFDGGGEIPILLLHGRGDNLATWGGVAWQGLVKWLYPKFRIVAMDLRGHGQSPPPEHFSFERVLDDVDAIIAALNLDNPYVVGHSMGGRIACDYGLRHPDCAGVVDIAGTRIRPEDHIGVSPAQVLELEEELLSKPLPPNWSGTGDELEERLRPQRESLEASGGNWEAVAPELRRGYILGDDGLLHSNPPQAVVAEIVTAIKTAYMTEIYWQIRCPVLFVVATRRGEDLTELDRARFKGTHDVLQKLQAARSNVHLEWIDCGHHIPNERPQELAEAINSFIEKSR